MPIVRSAQAVACTDLWFQYNGAQPIIRGLNLELAAGEMGVLFGRSGEGKTTLLRCVTGYETPTKGLIDCTSVHSPCGIAGSVDEPSRTVARFLALQEALRAFDTGKGFGGLYRRPAEAAMMFADDANLLPQLTAGENLHFPLAPICADRELRNELVDTMLALVGLTKFRQQRPNSLSTGQKRRLSLAQCLIRGPGLVALDEPTSALDTGTKFDILRLIMDLHASGSYTALVVTHDIDTALLLADVVFRFSNGTILAVDRIEEARYRSPEQLSRPTLQALRHELVRFVSEPGNAN